MKLLGKKEVEGRIDKTTAKYREYVIKKAAIVKIVVFLSMIVIGAAVSLMIPLRPTESITERRTLSKFPTFTFESFWSGEYFTAIDTWFSDTFPGRDNLIVCSETLENMYGIQTNSIHGEVIVGDDIPDVDLTEYDLTINADAVEDLEDPETETAREVLSDQTYISDYSYDSASISASDVGMEVEDTDGTTAAKAGESLGSIFVVEDSAYNYYTFLQSESDRYANIVNNLANTLDGKAKVYDMIVPTSIDITLDDATRNSISSSNQKKAILYMFSKMNNKVGKCYIYDLLREHRNEYIYFRTDHHWTSLGAYYAYGAFMTQIGKSPASLDSFTRLDCGNFVGSFYTQTRATSLYSSPDNFVAYVPPSTNKMQFVNSDNVLTNYNIVTDVTGWNITSKYSAFIGGDNSYSTITNPNINDGSSILVIKESFGNALVPYLTENFQNVYVIDYRYYQGTVSELVDQYNIGTVLFINNVTATSTSARINDLANVCQ